MRILALCLSLLLPLSVCAKSATDCKTIDQGMRECSLKESSFSANNTPYYVMWRVVNKGPLKKQQNLVYVLVSKERDKNYSMVKEVTFSSEKNRRISLPTFFAGATNHQLIVVMDTALKDIQKLKTAQIELKLVNTEEVVKGQLSKDSLREIQELIKKSLA
ncbi:MAG: hypothetical protein AB7I18_04745 [Candidatus Berkiella sp.]